MPSRRLSLLGWLCGALALSFAASAEAQEATRARLLTVPTAQELTDHFPPVPLARGISGRVTLSCDVGIGGDSDCHAAEETPANMGFGAAAEALAADWRFEPRLEGGQPVTSTARPSIVFENAFSEAAPIGLEIIVAPPHASAPPNELSGNAITITACGRPGPCPDFTTGTVVQHSGYPADAEAARITGRALVACAVRSTRALDCVVEGETPGDHGFGQAAVETIRRANLQSPRDAGVVFRVPVQFAMRDEAGQIQSTNYVSYRPPMRRTERVFPSRALESERDGDVLLVCAIQTDRTLDCSIESETPDRYGFGIAALNLVQHSRLTEQSAGVSGFATGDRFEVPVAFRVN